MGLRLANHLPSDAELELLPSRVAVTDLSTQLRPRRLVHRWWFWTIVGVAVGGGAAATAIIADNFKRTRTGVIKVEVPLMGRRP